jgi:hypothetical protein
MGTNSSGVYRIPYCDGTPVRCTADDTTHSPPNRIDLAAQGEDRFNLVVAAADGIVRLIVDNFCENRPGLDPCNNNYVWIEHSNGEWTKYSHMIRNSVRRGAGLRVRAGRILGIEGDVGCADGQHLHFEVAELGADSNPISCDGVLKDKSRNRPLAKDASMNVDLDFLPLRARGRCWAPSPSPPSTARERSSWRAASSPSPVRSPELRHLLHTDFQIVGQLGHSALPAGPAKNSEGCRHVAAEEEELDSSADGEL